MTIKITDNSPDSSCIVQRQFMLNPKVDKTLREPMNIVHSQEKKVKKKTNVCRHIKDVWCNTQCLI